MRRFYTGDSFQGIFAVEELNSASGLLGRPLNLIKYDTQSSMQLYAQYAQQAALKDRAAVVHACATRALCIG